MNFQKYFNYLKVYKKAIIKSFFSKKKYEKFLRDFKLFFFKVLNKININSFNYIPKLKNIFQYNNFFSTSLFLKNT